MNSTTITRHRIGKRQHLTKICPVCGKEFHVMPSHYEREKHCSRKCADIEIREKRRKQLVFRIEKQIGEPLKDYLMREYVSNQKSFRMIRKDLMINGRTVPNLLKMYEIPIRHGSEAVKTQWVDNDKRRKKSAIIMQHIKSSFPTNPQQIADEELAKRCEGTEFKFIKRMSGNKIKIECKKCHTQMVRRPSFLSHNKPCHYCHSSFGEQKINKYLTSHKINFKEQVRFDDCQRERPLPFDFAIFDDQDKLLFLIEYDGKQHLNPEFDFGGKIDFSDRLKNDTIKTSYCMMKGIPLLRIGCTESIVKRLTNTLKLIS